MEDAAAYKVEPVKKHSGFQKGHDPNRNIKGRGRKSILISDTFKSALDDKVDGKSKLQLLLNKTLEMALAGDKWAIEYAIERAYGKTVSEVKLSGKVETTPTQVNIFDYDVYTEAELLLLEELTGKQPETNTE